jgi:hypothetical protein
MVDALAWAAGPSAEPLSAIILQDCVCLRVYMCMCVWGRGGGERNRTMHEPTKGLYALTMHCMVNHGRRQRRPVRNG